LPTETGAGLCDAISSGLGVPFDCGAAPCTLFEITISSSADTEGLISFLQELDTITIRANKLSFNVFIWYILDLGI